MRPMVRQDAFLHAHHVNFGKLQPLGRVKGHQGHGIAFQLRFLVLVGFVAGQRNLVQKAGDGGLRDARWQ